MVNPSTSHFKGLDPCESKRSLLKTEEKEKAPTLPLIIKDAQDDLSTVDLKSDYKIKNIKGIKRKLAEVAYKANLIALKTISTLAFSAIVLAFSPFLLALEAKERLLNKKSLFTKIASMAILPGYYSNNLVEEPPKIVSYNISNQTQKSVQMESRWLFIEKTNLTASDSTRLEAFHVQKASSSDDPLINKKPHLVVVFLGNTDNARDVNSIASCDNALLNGCNQKGDIPTDYLFVNYRGMGGSEGLVSSGYDLISDGLGSIAWAQEWARENKTDLSSVTLYGSSIGGGVAGAVAEKYHEVHLHLNHTFTNWSDAAVYVVNNATCSYLGYILKPLFEAMGGNHLGSKKMLSNRMAFYLEPKHREKMGTVWIEKAIHDSILGEKASLDMPISSMHQYKKDFRLVHVDCDHLRNGPVMYDSHAPQNES